MRNSVVEQFVKAIEQGDGKAFAAPFAGGIPSRSPRAHRLCCSATARAA